MKFLSITSVFTLLLASTANASPDGRVGGATVKKRLASFEVRGAYLFDDTARQNDRFRTRQHFDYGVTNTYAARVVTFQNKFKGENYQSSTYRLENRFHLITSEDYGWDGGIRLTYNANESGPDEARIRLVADVPLDDRWTLRNNTLVGHEIGPDSRHGLDLELRNRALYKTDYQNNLVKSLKVGPTLYNTIGKFRDQSGFEDQQHQLGVIANMKLQNNVYGEVLYRRGLTGSTVQDVVGFSVGVSF